MAKIPKSRTMKVINAKKGRQGIMSNGFAGEQFVELRDTVHPSKYKNDSLITFPGMDTMKGQIGSLWVSVALQC